MKCPSCGSLQVHIVDSRGYDTQVRRRRECLDCLTRFNTIEIHLEEHKILKQREHNLRTLKSQLLAFLNKLIK